MPSECNLQSIRSHEVLARHIRRLAQSAKHSVLFKAQRACCQTAESQLQATSKHAGMSNAAYALTICLNSLAAATGPPPPAANLLMGAMNVMWL